MPAVVADDLFVSVTHFVVYFYFPVHINRVRGRGIEGKQLLKTLNDDSLSNA